MGTSRRRARRNVPPRQLNVSRERIRRFCVGDSRRFRNGGAALRERGSTFRVRESTLRVADSSNARERGCRAIERRVIENRYYCLTIAYLLETIAPADKHAIRCEDVLRGLLCQSKKPSGLSIYTRFDVGMSRAVCYVDAKTLAPHACRHLLEQFEDVSNGLQDNK